mgnify:CR=1 FL=1
MASGRGWSVQLTGTTGSKGHSCPPAHPPTPPRPPRRVLGISGAVKGLVCGSQEAWRVAFVAGLLAGGAVLRSLLPTAFEAFPAEYTLWRALLAGLLVGLGTARGSG